MICEGYLNEIFQIEKLYQYQLAKRNKLCTNALYLIFVKKMNILFKFIVLIFALEGGNIFVVDGFSLLAPSKDGDLISNSSDILSNYCQSCKWGKKKLTKIK